ncbi:MAG: hypothetical protein JSW17_01875 [Candidatus Omnitrophota bacterium]|nr:MAG: hypothetical protein JSW17_01875 [Candidatus Omnitrophota bacterium]
MRTVLSKITSIKNSIDNDSNLSKERLITSPKAETMWRAIRTLNEEKGKFITSDILVLCGDISLDYAKKFVINLYFRGIIERLTPSIGTKPAVYVLKKDKKPDPLFIPPYTYRRLIGSKAKTDLKSSKIVKETQSTPSEKNVEKSDSDTLKPDSTTAIVDRPDISKPDKTATKAGADDTKTALYILKGYHNDLTNKVQRFNLYVHRIGNERKTDNIQEGFLLLDLIKECFKLYFSKVIRAEKDGIISSDDIQSNEGGTA